MPIPHSKDMINCVFSLILQRICKASSNFSSRSRRYRKIFSGSFHFPSVGTTKNVGTMWVHFDPLKKKNLLRSVSKQVACGDSRSRTDDPLLAKQVL